MSRAFEVQAIRIHDGVELPGFELQADRVLPVVERPYADSQAWALAALAFFWHRAQEAGTSEEDFRAMLRLDPDLRGYADLRSFPAYQPARTLTRREAEHRLTRGLGERIR